MGTGRRPIRGHKATATPVPRARATARRGSRVPGPGRSPEPRQRPSGRSGTSEPGERPARGSRVRGPGRSPEPGQRPARRSRVTGPGRSPEPGQRPAGRSRLAWPGPWEQSGRRQRPGRWNSLGWRPGPRPEPLGQARPAEWPWAEPASVAARHAASVSGPTPCRRHRTTRTGQWRSRRTLRAPERGRSNASPGSSRTFRVGNRTARRFRGNEGGRAERSWCLPSVRDGNVPRWRHTFQRGAPAHVHSARRALPEMDDVDVVPLIGGR